MEMRWPMSTVGLHLLFFRHEVIILALLITTFTLFHFLCVVMKQTAFPTSLIQDGTSSELQSLGKFRQMNKCMKAPKAELLVCQVTSS